MKFLSIVTIGLIFFVGCSSTKLETTNRFSNDIKLKNLATKKMIYLSVKNKKVPLCKELNNKLIEKLQKKGYRLVGYNKASIKLFVHVRNSDNYKPHNSKKDNYVGAYTAGAMSGGMPAGGNGIGVAIAAAVGYAVSKINDKQTISISTDVILEQKHQKNQKTTITSQATQKSINPNKAIPVLLDELSDKIVNLL